MTASSTTNQKIDVGAPVKVKDTEARLPMVRALVLQDHLVNDLSTEDAFPTEEKFAITIKLFIDHHSTATTTPHIDLLHLERQMVFKILPSANPWPVGEPEFSFALTLFRKNVTASRARGNWR
jgi:hypothetical protein